MSGKCPGISLRTSFYLSGDVNSSTKKFKKSCPSRVGGGSIGTRAKEEAKTPRHLIRPPLSEKDAFFGPMLFLHSLLHWQLAKEHSMMQEDNRKKKIKKKKQEKFFLKYTNPKK